MPDRTDDVIGNLVAEWLRRGLADMTVVSLSDDERIAPEILAFHAQQAVEKPEWRGQLLIRAAGTSQDLTPSASTPSVCIRDRPHPRPSSTKSEYRGLSPVLFQLSCP